VEFVNLFRPEEGRMGVTVTFVAILELVREGLIDIVQTEAYAPLHVRSAQGARGLKLAVDNDAIIEGAADEEVMTDAGEPGPAISDDHSTDDQPEDEPEGPQDGQLGDLTDGDKNE
jgi:segregation and condensation protein A